MNLNKTLLYIIVLLALFNACTNDKVKNIPDVSHIKTSINLIRFDKMLFELDTNDMVQSFQSLSEKQPYFTELFFTRILPVKRLGDTTDFYLNNIKGFLQDPGIQQLYDTTQIVFGDLTPIKAQFDEAFNYYQYYFPERNVPDIYSCITEYGFGTILFPDQNNKDALAISLDMYLGADYPYRLYNPNNTTFSAYNTRSFNREHMVKKACDALIADIILEQKGTRLIDYMIHNGKKLYLLDLLLPYAPDSIKMEYSSNQMNWINDDLNEREIWKLFLEDELLYSTDNRKIQKLVNPSPHSPGMPPEAPGRTANWLGWQMVKGFMKRHPDTTIKELIAFEDAQELMNLSKYKPPR